MSKPPSRADAEIKVCGLHACQAVFRRRPEDIRRLYIAREVVPSFGDYLKILAERRVAYHVVGDDELERITQSVHHGGVAMIVREAPSYGLGGVLSRVKGEGPCALLYLDNVQNPHNLGAIVRVAANFGVDAVLVAGEAGPSPAMMRTAEGGAEFVPVVPVPLGAAPLQRLREAGFRLLATTSHGEGSLFGRPLPARAVIMLGSESHGLAPAVLAQAGRDQFAVFAELLQAAIGPDRWGPEETRERITAMSTIFYLAPLLRADHVRHGMTIEALAARIGELAVDGIHPREP